MSTRWTRHAEDTRVHLVDRPSLRRASRRSDSGVHRMDTSVHEATLHVHGGDHLRGLLGRLHLRRAVRALRRRGLLRAPPRLERRVVILDLGDRAGRAQGGRWYGWGWGDTPGLLSIAGLHLVELRLLPLKCRDREIVCGGLEARGDLVVGGGELARFLRVRGRGMVKARSSCTAVARPGSPGSPRREKDREGSEFS